MDAIAAATDDDGNMLFFLLPLCWLMMHANATQSDGDDRSSKRKSEIRLAIRLAKSTTSRNSFIVQSRHGDACSNA